MTRLGARLVSLFALAATVPVALTALVWVGLSTWGVDRTASEASLARAHLRTLDHGRKIAVERLCRDDLAVDTLLEDLSRGETLRLDYDRLLGSAMHAAGFQVLWALDSMSGRIVAAGHTHRPLGTDGTTLRIQARSAADRPFAIDLGAGEHQRFVLRTCSISRGGARLTIVAGHRLSELRSLDPEQLVVTGSPGRKDEVVWELADAQGVRQGVIVWRPTLDRRGPPLILWIASVAILALGLALLFGGYVSRWLQASVGELTEAASRVGRGDFETTLRDDTVQAFPATATAFNRMTRDLRDARERLRQTERVAAWQEIAKSLAHELKNPLSPIRLSIETLRKARERSLEDFDAMFDESTKTILQEVDRLRNIVDEFSRFARLPAPVLRVADLGEIVSQAASLHGDGKTNLSVELPENATLVMVDADQMTQVMHNLLQNANDAALEAHPSGGAAVRVRLVQTANGVLIQVEDNGPGIAADQVEAVFEPYYTRKEGGTGLGLAISQRIVTEHGGRIDVESKAGRTVFSVVLPSRR